MENTFVESRVSSTVKYRTYINSLTVYDLRRELSAWRFYVERHQECAERIVEEKIEPIEFELKRLGYEV